MRIIVGCEKSQRVAAAFRARGHDAWSCDIQETTGDPRYHIQGDVLDHLNNGWDIGIFHPTCTYLTGAAEWAYADVPMIKGVPRKIKPGTLIGAERRQAREDALIFVSKLWNSNIPKICTENPVGIISTRLPYMGKPQYVQQHWFGEDASKTTGLWLKNLPKLVPTNKIEPRLVCQKCKFTIHPPYNFQATECSCGGKLLPRWGNQTDSGQNKLPPSADRWEIRSVTPQGLADAMAEQWGNL